MIPIRQKYGHNPARGVYGDCHRACLASLFHLDIDDVPHFGRGGASVGLFNDRVNAWLCERNLAAANMPHSGTLVEVLQVLSLCSPDSYWLLGCTDRNGHNHSVVGKGGRILHDPSGSRLGGYGPCTDGVFWITYLVPRWPELCHVAMRWELPAPETFLDRLRRSVRRLFARNLPVIP